FFLFFLHFYCPRNREGHSERQPLLRKNDSFRVIVVERGSIELVSGDTCFVVKRGDEIFVPHGVKEY
ncbi:hypothetical protein, partial [Ruthenibacterium lactatiformans]|uniref:hypothetical protein n=1 Tax=Ruthenibacterium lactatiformans TaxID=1550024 RepID=UPI0026DA6F10